MNGTTYAVTSNDTLTLNGRVFNNFADDDTTNITLPNELVTIKTGKNGNSLFAQNQQGLNSNVVLRLMRGSPDDQYMNGLQAASLNDFPSTVLLNGSFRKRIGDGAGNITADVYTLGGGVASKIPDAKENVSGDVAQAVSVWAIKFANTSRSQQ